MSILKEQAVQMLQNVPDDKMIYVIDMLEWLNGIFNDKSANINKKSATMSSYIPSKPIEVWEEFKKYKGIIAYDIDEKAELAKAREEKYADFT